MARKPIPIEPYIEKLEQAILIGATYELAAKFAGISHDTFDRWRKAAVTAKPGTPLAELRDRLEQAEGRAAIGWLAKIEKAANEGNWQAASWKLERRYPEQFGRTMHKLALTDPSGEQPWEPTVGLAALLEAARKRLMPTNGQHVPQLPEGEGSC
jgi:transposase